TSADGLVSTGSIIIAAVAPSLFTANASGQGLAAAVVLRVKENGTQSFEPIAQFDAAQNRVVPVPIDLGPATDELFLILYGTGIRFHSSLSATSATIGGTASEVLFAGMADGYVGLDQVNLRIPRSLAGQGVVNVVLTVNGKAANTVTIQIK
ncbi:MAG: hypothetical protein M3X11_08070, partial [Acidobacteriota bacterium]|nr:hypothetical protein [Acidobacteriota bacterium]